jgi:hypothetical protein
MRLQITFFPLFASLCICAFSNITPVNAADDDPKVALQDADFEEAFEEAVEEGGKKDADDDPATKVIKELILLGGGVQPILYGKDGSIETMLIVGSSSIPRSLSGSKGKQLAMKRARVETIKHFLRFLSEEASLYETQEDEFIVATEGSAVDDELSESESSKVISKGTEKFESTSKGLARGMERIGVKLDAEGRTMYLAYGWSKENDAAAEKLSQRGKGGSSKAGSGGLGGSAKPGAGGNDLEDEEVISSRANKFFKKK